jgi:hypothetical protein
MSKKYQDEAGQWWYERPHDKSRFRLYERTCQGCGRIDPVPKQHLYMSCKPCVAAGRPLSEESRQKVREAQTTHGETNTRLYVIWLAMRRRCGNPNSHNYKYYGGKGVRVCDEWNSNYENFRDWARENGYEDNLTIDRIDSDGNYEPSNCRFITAIQNIKRIYYENGTLGL